MELGSRGIRPDAALSHSGRLRHPLTLLLETGETRRGPDRRGCFDVRRRDGVVMPARVGWQVAVTVSLDDGAVVVTVRDKA